MHKLFIHLLKGNAARVEPKQVAALLKYCLSVAGNYNFTLKTRGQRIIMQMINEETGN